MIRLLIDNGADKAAMRRGSDMILSNQSDLETIEEYPLTGLNPWELSKRSLAILKPDFPGLIVAKPVVPAQLGAGKDGTIKCFR